MPKEENTKNQLIDLSQIPQKPGCYFFLDQNKKIIYIGKAASLRNRVSSYWRESADHSPAKFSMLKRVADIQWIVVESEIEALLLESNLIKKHQPEYNVVMRDDKRYVYIKISTEEEFPRVFLARQIEKSGRYFGPFVSAEAVRETLKIIRKIWPFRTCFTMPDKSCLYYRIGKCPGVCEGRMSKEDYDSIIKDISLFLEGDNVKLVDEYKGQVEELKKHTTEIEKEVEELELLLLEKMDRPKLHKLQKRKDLLRAEMEKVKSETNKFVFRFLNLQKILAHSNILSLSEKYAADVIELAKVLGLPKAPERIEGYDISNIFGRAAVGSMVVFKNGEPDKNEYRKFKIKSEVEGDVNMLKEVLERRVSRIVVSDLVSKKTWPTPDFIIIDGGKAQLNVVLKILRKNKLDIPVLAISKGEGLRSAKAPDKIFFPGEKKPLQLPLASPALHVIKRVRDEAHRFAVEYHKKIRGKKVFNIQ